MNDASQGSIERFVRGTLGCGCPDEVFQSVAISRLPPLAGRPPILQLLVGSRLLIHVVAMSPDATTAGLIEQLVANGRAARDCHGYNRFRLVVASAEPLPSAREITERFARAVVGDDRVHLHLLPADQLPGELGTVAK